GQAQKKFSAAKGMGLHKFNYWFRKLKRERETPSGFVRVDTGTAHAGPDPQELVFPNGVRLWDEVGYSLQDRVLNNLFMQEYGHTFDRQIFGAFYLSVVVL